MDVRTIQQRFTTYWMQIVVCLTIISAISCSKQDNASPNLQHKQSEHFNTPQKQIQITNPSDSLMYIRFYLDQSIWYNKSDILHGIKRIETDSIPGIPHEIVQAWVFIMDNSFHFKNFPEKHTNQAKLLLNSFGGALCNVRNQFLANIWRWQGYKSRCIHLEGHVVPEFYYNKQWIMLDADFNTYFQDSNSQIASVHLLEQKIDSLEPRHHNASASTMQVMFQLNPSNYNAHFVTTENNKIIEIDTIAFPKPYLSLPAHSTLEIPSSTDNTGIFQLASISIPDTYEGYIHIPFAVHSISYSDKETKLSENTTQQSGNYKIKGENCQILFYINPIFSQDGFQHIDIQKDKKSKLIISAEPTQLNNSFLTFRKNLQSLDPSLLNQLAVGIATYPQNFQVKTDAEFKDKFADFLSHSKIQTNDSIETKCSAFISTIEEKEIKNDYYKRMSKQHDECLLSFAFIVLLPPSNYFELLSLY